MSDGLYEIPDPDVAGMVACIAANHDPVCIMLAGERGRHEVVSPDVDAELVVVMPDGTDLHAAEVAMHRDMLRLPGRLTPLLLVLTTPEALAGHRSRLNAIVIEALDLGRVVHGWR